MEVMLAAARNNVQRVVFSSSSSVYGIPVDLPCRETMVPNPLSPYGVSKLAAEHYVRTLGAINHVQVAILRFFNVFGPGQDPRSEYAAVVPKFVTDLLDGRRPTVFGSVSTSRDFTYVDNAIAAVLLAAAADAPSYLLCNVACGQRHSLLELLEAISEAIGVPAHPVYGPPRPGDIRHSMADISVAQRALGYRVEVPFEEGLRRTVGWYLHTRDGAAQALSSGRRSAMVGERRD
jgi:UDP-glucose 4-epimerase